MPWYYFLERLEIVTKTHQQGTVHAITIADRHSLPDRDLICAGPSRSGRARAAESRRQALSTLRHRERGVWTTHWFFDRPDADDCDTTKPRPQGRVSDTG